MNEQHRKKMKRRLHLDLLYVKHVQYALFLLYFSSTQDLTKSEKRIRVPVLRFIMLWGNAFFSLLIFFSMILMLVAVITDQNTNKKQMY